MIVDKNKIINVVFLNQKTKQKFCKKRIEISKKTKATGQTFKE